MYQGFNKPTKNCLYHFFPWQPLITKLMHIAFSTIFWRYLCNFFEIYCKYFMIRSRGNRRIALAIFRHPTLTPFKIFSLATTHNNYNAYCIIHYILALSLQFLWNILQIGYDSELQQSENGIGYIPLPDFDRIRNYFLDNHSKQRWCILHYTLYFGVISPNSLTYSANLL